MSSQITLTQSPNTHPLAHIPDTCALVAHQQSLLFYSLHQQHHVTASHPSPCANLPESGWEGQNNAGPSKNCGVELNLPMHQGSPLLRSLSRSLHHHPPAAQCHPHAIHPTQPQSTPFPPCTNIRHQHLSVARLAMLPYGLCQPSMSILICCCFLFCFLFIIVEHFPFFRK